MKKIKFSQYYRKMKVLGSDMKATLLDVMEVSLEDLSEPLLSYDTNNFEYKLPKKGKYLMLFLQGANGLMITLRSAYPQTKVDYYKNSIGEVFEIELTK